MRAIAGTLLAAVVLTGCAAADPCAGVGGTCVSARVEGNVTGIDSLRITVAGQPAPMSSTPGGTITLPVRVALALPQGITSPAQITVDGLAGGAVRATSGVQSVPLTGGGHSSFTFHLDSAIVGGGDLDMANGGGSDGPPAGVVSFYPSSTDFGQTARGSLGQIHAVKLTNNTTQTVNLTNMPMPTGDGNAWQLEGMTTCFALDAGNGMGATISLAAGASCLLSFQFVPDKSGSLMMTLDAQFNDGETASLRFTGVGMPAWSGEFINMNQTPPPSLNAVWGTGTGDYYVAANDTTAPPVFRGDASGNWQRWVQGTNPLGTVTYAVTGSDAQHIWVGGQNGIISFSNGSQSWTAETLPNSPLTGNVTGLWARDSSVVYATLSSKTVGVRSAAGTWSNVLAAAAAHAFNAVCGAGMRVVAVGGDSPGAADNAQLFATDATGAMLSVVPNPFGAFTGSLRGCWMSDANNVWVVGDAGAGTVGIFHCTATGTAWSCGHETAGGVTSNLVAVAGRVVPGGSTLDLYAVGALGNQVLHSDGSGTWTSRPIANNQAMVGVWVGKDGEALLVGFSGQVNRFK
ncbi:MAG: hypothetical protein JWN44_1459 [Myxococcales bacterium]|nr:hypothetical protein [Myxococcales bacterium]